MGSIQRKLDERDSRYLKFVVARAHGATDEEIVKELDDPDIDSPQVLYRRLSADGYPVRSACGKAPVTGEHCEPSKKPRKSRRGGGEGMELPPPSSAVELFTPVVDSLDLVELSTLSHVYRNERFETVEIIDMAAFVDSSENIRTFGKSIEPRGATQSPAPLLTKLIALYVIAGEPVERLLAALHPRYSALSTEEEDKINQRAEKLALVARQLAKEVCAELIRPGHHTEEFSGFLQAAANYRNRQLRAGVPEHQIEQTLINRGLTAEEMEQVKEFSTTIFPG